MRINGRYVDRELYNFGIVIGLTLLFYVNVLSTKYNKLGIVIGTVGILIVFLLLSINKITISYLFFLAFLTTTIEVQEFVYGYVLPDNLVVRNFLILPGFHLWPVYIYNIVVFAYLFLQLRISIWRKILRFKGVKCLYFFSLLTLFAGLTMTIITYLMNDNGITDMYWLLDKFQAEFYRISMVFFTIQINIMLLIRYPEYKGQLVSFSKAIFLSIVLAGYISVFSGYHGYYGDRSDIMLLPLFSFFSVLQLTFIAYQKRKRQVLLWGISGCLDLVIMLQYASPLGGKWILVVMIVPIIILTKMVLSNSHWKYIIVMLMGTIIVSFLYVLPVIVQNNTLLQYKFKQAIEMIDFFSPNWYEKLSISPKFRIDEFLNVILEYMKKPYYLFFGKGIVGSVKQHTSTLDWGRPGSFSSEQVNSGVFINLHESINLIFLKYGLLGLYYFFKVIFLGVKNFVKSQWIIVGVLWWVLFYDCYNSLLFGVVLLVLGFWEADSLDFRVQ